MTAIKTYWDDEAVDGSIVIGDVLFPYQFWTRDGKREIARGLFANDEEAVKWFQENHRQEYRYGAEMRAFGL